MHMVYCSIDNVNTSSTLFSAANAFMVLSEERLSLNDGLNAGYFKVKIDLSGA